MITQNTQYASTNAQSGVKRFDGQDKYGKCLNCAARLTFCGQPFTSDIACPKCGVVNVYVESFQPVRLKERLSGQAKDL